MLQTKQCVRLMYVQIELERKVSHTTDTQSMSEIGEISRIR